MTYTVLHPHETTRLNAIADELETPMRPQRIEARCVEFSAETQEHIRRCREMEGEGNG